MRPRAYGILAILLLFLLAFPLAISVMNNGTIGGLSQTSHVLAPGNQSYKENLSVYLTSGQSFWKADFNGGNITVNSVSVPSSVSGYSITLTNYQTWKSQYELFTKYGFGLLGNNEPTPGGAYLQINTSSSTDAQSLVQSLSQRFGLVFESFSQTTGSFTFFAPLSFKTEIHVYFWKLLPSSYGGFASLVTEQSFEGAALSYYKLAYSSTTSYSISIGEIAGAASSQFNLYSILGLTGNSYNYSKYASSSSIGVHVLGGLITNASVPFSDNYSNLSASMTASSQSGNGTIPNLNATLNLSFPNLVAYRQISTLTPAKDTNVTVTIFIKDVSPSSSPVATNVTVNDNWLKSYPNLVQLTNGNTSTVTSLSSNAVATVAYSFRVTASNGTINIPATPVKYQFSAGNKSVNSEVFLNPETLNVGAQNSPALEAIASVSSSSVQVGQAFAVNVTIANKGSGTAFNVKSSGLTKSDLPAGSTWSFITNTTSASLTQTNVNVSYSVTWSDSSGANHTANTNTLSAVFGFGSPATPAVGVNKIVALTNSSNLANVTLVIYNSSPNEVKNISIFDPLPSGVAFARSSNTTELRASGQNGVNGNLSVLAANSNTTLHYQVNISNVNENYVFMPASVSAAWNAVTITHYSNGFSLPLGIVASKSISPNQGFQGSNVTVSIGVTNKGSMPVYFLSLNNTLDSFMNETKSASNYTTVLNSGQTLNASTRGNLIGSQGLYNSTPSIASFIFGGSNNTAVSKPVSVSVYGLVEANFSSSALKYEENHNINITVAITNPSNVTVSNVKFGMHLPEGLQVVGNGQTNFTINTLAPGQTQHVSVVVITNQPNVYSINSTNAQLTFTYQGLVLKGAVSSLTLTLQDDLTLRYGIPIVIAVAFVLLTLFYVRRLQKSK